MKRNIIALELPRIERNVSPSASNVRLAKTHNSSFDLRESLGSQSSCHATRKLGLNSSVLCHNTENAVELKHCEPSSSYRVFNLMKLKPEKERYYLILEYDYVT